MLTTADITWERYFLLRLLLCPSPSVGGFLLSNSISHEKKCGLPLIIGQRRSKMGFFAVPAAGVGFFVSSFLLMIFWGIIAPDFGMQTIGYKMAMLITIAIWLAVAPLVAATVKRGVKKSKNHTLSPR